MIKSSQIIIPIPKSRNTHCKVTINDVDVTGRIIDSLWISPCTKGVGTFTMKISNSFGQLSGSYNPGDQVKFYADNADASTLQFWGRIDYTKDDLTSNGQYLNIEGRHRSFQLNEFVVCHSTRNPLTGTETPTATSQILLDIIALLPASYGFTSTNVQTDTTLMNVEWNYKLIWDCITELCNAAGFDCYVDNDLDFHYFSANSIENNSDAVVEGDNYIQGIDAGTNDLYSKTRVMAIGRDDEGMPLIYTAISPTEDIIRETYVSDLSANTYNKVKDIATANLAYLSGFMPQSKVKSFGLETVKPGDNIWFIMPRQKIAGQYKIVQINHLFGQKPGGWRTEVVTEVQEPGLHINIKNLRQTQQIPDASNQNKLNYSYNFDFNTDVGEHTGTIIEGSVLKSDGTIPATWISPARNLDKSVSFVELRIKGTSLQEGVNLAIYVTLDGITYYPIMSNLKYSVSGVLTGKKLRVKVTFVSTSPQIDSLALLYS